MSRPKHLFLFAIVLFLCGVLAAQAVTLLAPSALAVVGQYAPGWALALDYARPDAIDSVCPGFACVSARVAPQSTSGNAATTVTFTRLDAAVSPVWLALLSAVLGGAGIAVLGAVVIFAARPR